jgi:lipopolysaccharide transport system permease protein
MEKKVLYVIEPSKGFLNFGIKDAFGFSELLYYFAWRDIKVRYKQTILGFAWVLLQPIALMSIMVFIFGTKFNMTSASIEYPVFVLSGLIFWNAFSSSVNYASSSMISQANIIKKIYFPRILIPISGILVSLFDLLITLFLFFVVSFYYDEGIDFLVLIWCLPLALMLQVLASTAISLWASALTVKFRDFKFIIPISLQLLMFVSPIIFPLQLFSEEWIRYLLALNPMVAPIETFRMMFTEYGSVSEYILCSTLVGMLFCVSGLLFFRSTEQSMADTL